MYVCGCIAKIDYKIRISGPREMVQWVRALVLQTSQNPCKQSKTGVAAYVYNPSISRQ